MNTSHTDPDDVYDTAQQAADQINGERVERKAELTWRLNQLLHACAAVADLDDMLNDPEEEWAEGSNGWKDWLKHDDLEAFRHQLHTARLAVQTMAAIHRPHSHIGLWPEVERFDYNRLQRTDYAVIVSWPDGPVHVIGNPATGSAYTWLPDADAKAAELSRDASCRQAAIAVRARTWSTDGWSDPDRSED